MELGDCGDDVLGLLQGEHLALFGLSERALQFSLHSSLLGDALQVCGTALLRVAHELYVLLLSILFVHLHLSQGGLDFTHDHIHQGHHASALFVLLDREIGSRCFRWSHLGHTTDLHKSWGIKLSLLLYESRRARSNDLLLHAHLLLRWSFVQRRIVKFLKPVLRFSNELKCNLGELHISGVFCMFFFALLGRLCNVLVEAGDAFCEALDLLCGLSNAVSHFFNC